MSLFSPLELLRALSVRIHERWVVLALLILTLVIAFNKLDSSDISDYDEARQIVNAVEMNRNANWLNLYYNGEPDTWNAKPPLFVWSMVISMRVFGISLWSARLPAAMSGIVTVLLFYLLIRIHRGQLFALFTCLLLLSSKAVFGSHLARTADFDAMFVMFLTGGTVMLELGLRRSMKYGILMTGLFFGLAFLTKGTAIFLVIPGIVAYLFFTGQLRGVIHRPQTYFATLLFFTISLGWLILSAQSGETFVSEKSLYGASSSWYTLIYHDTIGRYFGLTGFEAGKGHRPLFFFVALDLLLNVWWYFILIGLAVGISRIYKQGTAFLRELFSRERLISISVFVTMPLVVLLSMSATQFVWYYGPITPYLAILITYSVKWLVINHKASGFLVSAMMVALLGRELLRTETYSEDKAKCLRHLQDDLHKSPIKFVDLSLGPSWLALVKLHSPQALGIDIDGRFQESGITLKTHPLDTEHPCGVAIATALLPTPRVTGS